MDLAWSGTATEKKRHLTVGHQLEFTVWNMAGWALLLHAGYTSKLDTVGMLGQRHFYTSVFSIQKDLLWTLRLYICTLTISRGDRLPYLALVTAADTGPLRALRPAGGGSPRNASAPHTPPGCLGQTWQNTAMLEPRVYFQRQCLLSAAFHNPNIVLKKINCIIVCFCL